MLSEAARATLAFYRDAGLTTIEGEAPGALWDWDDTPPRAPQAEPQAKPSPRAAAPGQPSADEAIAKAEEQAAACATLDELIAHLASLKGCPLHGDERQTVIHDGVLGADLLVLGEAPGAEEARVGKPFVGRSGQLLDRMLGAIGHSRAPSEEQRPVAITNAFYWRPEDNRNPNTAELAFAQPFVRRFIELSQPKAILLTGNVPTKALFPDAPGITRARGSFRDIEIGGRSIPALPVFHPAFLLRQPAQKRWAWRDLLALQAKLNETLS
ncbi:uracil-DNA glycosylase [Parvularcula sp. ZS-1/3]|uniref:Type-4 uracil-DNA glycosylase n=1 Tax=Parvularcula mediterranea TaxID=2732508 RepID=A0A7Y3RL89_9PROT|nr:uracil-DNA glycosylase [Parvularcula mediterranea]NNU15417.1 uracil-DNA glycosylase [Parvularcula mediterranea]